MFVLGLLFYIISIIFGLAIVSLFLDDIIKENVIKYAFAIPVGFTMATFLVLIMDAMFKGFNNIFVIYASLIMILTSTIILIKNKNIKMFKKELLLKQIKKEKLFYGILFVLIIALIILQIFGVHNSSNGIVGGDNYGTDFLFHISIGNSVIYTGWPPKLLYANYATNVFPFISDFYMSILIFNGIQPVYALYLINFLLYFSLVTSTVYFIILITKHKKAAIFAFILFLFCSVGLNMFLIYIFRINLPFFSYSQIQSMNNNLFGIVTYQLMNFAEPLENNFAPQHDYVLGFPLVMIVLSILYINIFENKKKNIINGIDKSILLAAIITGLMPLTHPFSLIFIFIFGIVAMFYSLLRKDKVNTFMKIWLPFGIISLGIAAPQLFFIHSGDITQGFLGSVLGLPFWSSTSIINAILLHGLFWLETIGPLLVVGIIGLYFFRKKIVVFIPVIIAFIIVNIIRFSPSFGDSNKIVIYFLLFMSISATELFYLMWKRGILFKIVVIVIFIIIIGGGVLGEYYDIFVGSYPIASNVEISATTWIINNTQVGNTFVDSCYNTVFGITSSLAGRRTLMEFEGYIGLVGIENYNVQEIDQQTQNFMMNPTCDFVNEYNISYVALENLNTFSSTWCDTVNYTKFSNSQSFQLYKGFNESSLSNNILIYKPICNK